MECLADPAQASRLLMELADDGEDVALVLVHNRPHVPAGVICSTTCGSSTRTQSVRSRPGRLLGGSDRREGDPASLALGRIDYYVASPAADSLDEVFH